MLQQSHSQTVSKSQKIKEVSKSKERKWSEEGGRNPGRGKEGNENMCGPN